jgi:dihydrofolate reductase
MRKLVVYNQISPDGYFVDHKGDMSWAHNSIEDKEWDEFVAGNATGGGVLLFGRITYELMAGFWPTEFAAQSMPVIAERMNNLPKILFSRITEKALWNYTKLIKENMVSEVRNMKNEKGMDMVIMGSGTIVSELTKEGLIDEYQFVVIPVILGRGRTMFEDIKEKVSIELTNSRTFTNGNVFLCYKRIIKNRE